MFQIYTTTFSGVECSAKYIFPHLIYIFFSRSLPTQAAPRMSTTLSLTASQRVDVPRRAEMFSSLLGSGTGVSTLSYTTTRCCSWCCCCNRNHFHLPVLFASREWIFMTFGWKSRSVLFRPASRAAATDCQQLPAAEEGLKWNWTRIWQMKTNCRKYNVNMYITRFFKEWIFLDEGFRRMDLNLLHRSAITFKTLYE